jgi:Protein of unknown function (DUF2911)
MRKALLFISTFVAAAALAQTPAPAVKYPRVSQKSVLMQSIGTTDMTITYSRPGVKGRKIWGALVPYGQVWRTGANEATTIQFSDDVTINGQKLPAGTYSLHSIPGEKEWTLIFNSVSNQWGSYSYDATKDTLRVKATPATASFTEWMNFEVPMLSTDQATVALRWENVAVPFTVNSNTTQKVLAAAGTAVTNAKADDWRTPYAAANFAFDNGMLTEASQWSDASLKAGESMGNLWLKARILAKQGKKADAIVTGEKALAKKTDKDSADLAAEIRKTVDDWKK